jgi:gamma-D-glutamyl-L-lysine dipeptidyl-peptidase
LNPTSSSDRLTAVPVAPMFREPDPLSEHVSQALLGMGVQVLDTRGIWCRIRTPDTYEGWVAAETLSRVPAGWVGPWAEMEDLLPNLRARPEYRQAAVLQAPIGCRLPLVGSQEPWVELLLPDGRRLWTEAKRVRLEATSPRKPRADAILKTARRLLGVPYLWGGNSPLGLDCSGFVQLVYRLHGIALLRDAHLQHAQGTAVDEPAAADLAFFGPVDRPDRITHVGMMLDGVRFIHAAGSDRVRINRLSDEGYADRGRGLRRFL